jgi:hypothetical protein
MTPYFVLMLPPVIFSVLRVDRGLRDYLLAAFFVFMFLFIGYRFSVGMDWNNYVYKINNMRLHDFSIVFSYSEIASNAVIWLASRTALGIVTLNLVAGFIMCVGLLIFVRATENPWLTLVVTIPYYVIVVMSASRQSMAIFIIFALYALWNRVSLAAKVATIFVAALFHTSAFVCAIFLLPEMRKLSTLGRISFVVAFSVAAFYFLFMRPANVEQFEYYNQVYIEYSDFLKSPGALSHVMMIVIPSMVYVLFYRKWREAGAAHPLVLQNCLVSLAVFPGVFIYPTAFDRLSLYFAAGALVAMSSMPRVMTRNMISRKLFEAGIVLLHVAILYIWLTYANSALAWVPYRNVLLGY